MEKAKIAGHQSAYNAFVLTFPTPEEAKLALEETKKSLTNAGAAVSETKNIIKVYKVLANSNNARREVFIGNLSYENGAEGVTSSIRVTMFDELEEKTNYIISYKDHDEVSITTTTYVADGLKLSGHRSITGVDVSEEYSVLEVRATLYTADGVLIGDSVYGSCNKYRGWYDSLMLEDTNKEWLHSEYQFDPALRKIWFYTSDRNYKVRLKGVYEDWVNITTGNPKVIETFGEITPLDNNIYVNESFDWCIVPGTPNGKGDKNWWNADWKNKTFASEDSGYYLLVKANITEEGKDPEDKYSDTYSIDDNFTFVSANDDRLAVNYETGELYPPKTAVNDVIGIHVYYKGKYVNTCRVEIIAKRTLATLSAQVDKTKVTYNSTNLEVKDNEIFITLYPKDQLGQKFSNISGKVEVSDNNLKQYFNNNGFTNQVDYYNNDGYPVYKLELGSGFELTHIMNVRLKCTAEYFDGTKTVVKQYPVSFSMKDTTKSTSVSYRLAQVPSVVDMKIWKKNDGTTNVEDKYVKITAYGYDKDGYKVEKLHLDESTPGSDGSVFGIEVKYGSVEITNSDRKELTLSADPTINKKEVVFRPVIRKIRNSYYIATGSSVTKVENVTRSAIEKLSEGNYVVALYSRKDGVKYLKDSRLLNLKDNQDQPKMNWVRSTTEEYQPLEVIRSAVQITSPNGTNVLKTSGLRENLYYIDKNVDSTAGVDDIRINGQNLYIEGLRYVEPIGSDWLEFYIPIKRTVIFGTNIYN